MTRWFHVVVRIIQGAFLIAAATCAAWLFMTWNEAGFYTLRAKNELVALADAAPLPPASRSTAGVAAIDARDESLVGMLEIPRLQISVAVLEGEEAATLTMAVGHLRDTPMPWDEGNSALAGHRDSFFRRLGGVRVGDDMRLVTRHGELPYQVRFVGVVHPDDVWILRPSTAPVLTLVTCYPFEFLGPAPLRFVVQAERLW